MFKKLTLQKRDSDTSITLQDVTEQKKVVEKAGRNFQQQQQQQQQNNPASGSDTYASPISPKPKETKKVGEYVDFEEIE